jgi:hypothetical protein
VDGTVTGQFDTSRWMNWSAVQGAIADGTYKDIYRLGDRVPIDLGEYGIRNMQIVAFDTDDKADGSGKAAISWVSETLITKRAMNTASTNENGWVASEMRSWLQGDFYAILPADVKASIVSVNKTFFDCTTQSTLSCADNVWIPSQLEIYYNGGGEDSGARYREFFTSDHSTRKKKDSNGTISSYWVRTAYSYSPSFMYCGTGGMMNFGGSTSSYGVALGFCT